MQLREHSDVARGHWAGRVEHVTSGQVAHFQSLDKMLAFVAFCPDLEMRPASELKTDSRAEVAVTASMGKTGPKVQR